MNDHVNAYLESRVLSAGPEELRLMLIAGALRFATEAREGLAARDFERSYEGTRRCQEILLELVQGLRPEHDPDLCSRLSGIYMYVYRRLIDASIERDPAIADEAVRLLDYDRESWLLLMERRRSEHADASAGAAPPPADAGTVPARPRSLSLEA